MASSTAADIVDSVGGPQNIESMTHCATRLRFQLRDGSVVDKDTVEAIPGVMGAVPQAGNRYQVVIGGAVQSVYDQIQDLPQMQGAGGGGDEDLSADEVKARERAKGPRGRFAWLDSLFEFLSDSFRPIIGALLGASLFITFMSLMSTLNVIGNWADPRTDLPVSWQFVNLMWKCVFVFLPLMVAYNASKKVGADPWVGFAIMAVVMLPGFAALAEGVEPTNVFGSSVSVVHVFGVPLTVFDYSSQVFPPLLMAAVLGLLWKGLTKVIPANIQLIFVPFLAMLVMIPLTAFLIGPIGVYAGAGLADVLKSINDFSPFIFAVVIPLAYPFMVPLGLHWPINAIMLLNIQTLGYDYIQGPMGAWNFACFGATAGVLYLAWRERDQAMRQTATGALAAGLLGGISEPSLYGIHLRFKRIYPRMLVGCLVGGLIIGFGGGVTTKAFVFTSLLTIPAFSSMGLYAVAVAAAFAVSMGLVIFSGYKAPATAADDAAAVPAPGGPVGAVAPTAGTARREGGRHAATNGAASDASASNGAAAGADAVETSDARADSGVGAVHELASPVDGTAIALADVPDPVFAAGTMGPGAAVDPSGDTVYSPGPGKVASAQPTGHAFALVIDGGMEVLVHVGIDTVNLKGRGFDVLVENGQRVETGTPLVRFDRKVIEEAGYSLVTPVIVLNGKKFDAVDPVQLGPIKAGEPLLSVEAKAAAPTA